MDRSKKVEIVEAFFRAWETSQSKLRPYLTDDVVWWTRWGTLGFDDFDIVAPTVALNLDERIKFTVRNIVTEGDQVAVEANATATLKSGAHYDQDYHFLLVFAGEKIKVVREYFDTQHAAEVWGPVLSVHVPGMTTVAIHKGGTPHADA